MIDYTEKIPNNVDLGRDRVLQRALEHWQPAFLGWWSDMGPNESSAYEVYLRTATSVEPDGWAQFGYVRMPEYRWGIFLQPRDEKRLVNFGTHKGQDAWQDVPGEYRSMLRRIIVTQGDTEPASVEQQKMLGLSCPSLYDLRNIFQVNVEEGRHLWAMVYLLHRYFGRDGREEAESLSGAAIWATPTIRGFWGLSMSLRRIGWRSICLRFLPIAMASFSFALWRSRDSIRFRGLAGLC